jgi:SOS-response transcriptional repressor LexA
LAVLSSDAKQLMTIVRQHYNEAGNGLNVSNAGELLGVTSKRQLQQLVEELERKGFVRTRKLRERGQPRIIEPISSKGAD